MIHAEPRRHRLYRLPPPVQHQPTQIQPALGPLVLPRQRREHPGHEGIQLHAHRRYLLIPHETKLTDPRQDKRAPPQNLTKYY